MNKQKQSTFVSTQIEHSTNAKRNYIDEDLKERGINIDMRVRAKVALCSLV